MDHASRRARLAVQLSRVQTDAFLVTFLPNVRYLTGFTGSNAQLLLSAGEGRFLTDGRYAEQSRREVPDLPRAIYSDGFKESLASACRELGLSKVAFEDSLSFKVHAEVAEAAGVALVPTSGEVERLRWVKDADEIANLEEAQAFADEALELVAGKLAEGVTEREVAFELESAMYRAGADGAGFETIAAFGPNAAEPHHHPTGRQLARGDVVKLDFGALKSGYHSDMTRTLSFGEPPSIIRELYEVVRASQQAGMDALRAGVLGKEADIASREVVARAGYAEAYRHSLGHGVGLEIHEGPYLHRKSEDVIPAGTVVTVEPGIYLEGVGGVRIEDMVEVTPEGRRLIPHSTRELIVL